MQAAQVVVVLLVVVVVVVESQQLGSQVGTGSAGSGSPQTPSWGFSFSNDVEATCCYHVEAAFSATVADSEGNNTSLDIGASYPNTPPDPFPAIYPGVNGGCSGAPGVIGITDTCSDVVVGDGGVSCNVDYYLCGTTSFSVDFFLTTLKPGGLDVTYSTILWSVTISATECGC